MSGFDAVRNLGLKAARRLQAAPKPLVRMMRRQARAREHEAFRRDAEAIDSSIAQLAQGTSPIIVGPWLAEVGYEVLYWIPFLRWLQDAHGIASERVVVVSRGGMESAYAGLAGRYVDLFDLTTPHDLATRNLQRRAAAEGGGQKQSSSSTLDDELLGMVRARLDIGDARVCHPSLMFRLFREVWHGNLPMDVLWRRTRYEAARLPITTTSLSVPNEFIAVKLYSGPALSMSDRTRASLRQLVARAAALAPVVLLDVDLGVDEHRDLELDDLPGVTSARSLMDARTNLGVQLALVARSRFFLSTCGGLAWLAPFLGVPTGRYTTPILCWRRTCSWRVRRAHVSAPPSSARWICARSRGSAWKAWGLRDAPRTSDRRCCRDGHSDVRLQISVFRGFLE